MPVDQAYVGALTAAVVDVYAAGEQEMVRRASMFLARHLDVPDWAARRLAEVRALRRAAELIADELELDGGEALRRAVAEAYRSGNASAVVDLAERFVGDVGPAARDVRARYRRRDPGTAIQALADAAVRELRPVHRAILPQVEGAYRDAVRDATARTLTGTTDRRRAAQGAWAALVDRGIVRYVDSAGRQWHLHSYVEMAVRTSVARSATRGLVDEFRAADQRLVYVTDTPGECEKCRRFEHRVLTLWGPVTDPAVATLHAATEAGLMHPGCHHGLAPWRPGLRLSRRTEDPSGEAARVRQRAIERHLRRWREREAAALTEDAAAHARQRVDAWDEEMAAHLEATGLPRVRHRELPGAGHTVAGKDVV